jgi:hypothetical protein
MIDTPRLSSSINLAVATRRSGGERLLHQLHEHARADRANDRTIPNPTSKELEYLAFGGACPDTQRGIAHYDPETRVEIYFTPRCKALTQFDLAHPAMALNGHVAILLAHRLALGNGITISL